MWKKIIKVIFEISAYTTLFSPIVSFILPYLFIIWALNFTDVYPNDPKATGLLQLYWGIIIFFWLNLLLIIPIVSVILIIYRCKYKFIIKWRIYIFIIGAVLFLVSLFYDPGNYLYWFFD